MTRKPSNVPNPTSASSAPLKPRSKAVPRRSEAEVLAAIPGTFGVVTAVARRLGVDRDTVMNYRARWPSVQHALKAEAERLLDLAEAKLYKRALEDGSERCLFYLLDSKGRSRGYGRTQHLKIEADAPLDADRLALLRQKLLPSPQDQSARQDGGRTEEPNP